MVSGSETNGSMPQRVNIQNVRYAPSMISAPCATLTMFMTPQMSDIPRAMIP
jgi:hypothetical protein